jgi:hypothetical protein
MLNILRFYFQPQKMVGNIYLSYNSIKNIFDYALVAFAAAGAACESTCEVVRAAEADADAEPEIFAAPCATEPTKNALTV